MYLCSINEKAHRHTHNVYLPAGSVGGNDKYALLW